MFIHFSLNIVGVGKVPVDNNGSQNVAQKIPENIRLLNEVLKYEKSG